MTATPTLTESDVRYALGVAETIVNTSKTRRAGESGEQQTQNILLNEFKICCDEIRTQGFKTHPGAGTLVEKLLCLLLTLCVILFSFSVSNGSVFPACIALFASLLIFCAFCYKFIFDGKKLDFITPTKRSKNILGVRYPSATPKNRIVLVSRSDAPPSLRLKLFGNKTPYILSLCSIIGNTWLFISCMLFLFAGAPADSSFFNVLQTICVLFIPFYFFAILLVSSKKNTSGISSSIIPSVILLTIMRQFYENSFRYEKTEICCLIAGSDYSSHAGAYAFIKKYKRAFNDIPTVFIPIEEITNSKNLAVFFRDGSGTKGSAEIASVINEAAENLKLHVENESFTLGTGSFSPFSKERFPACSLGTSKKNTTKTISAYSDTLSTVNPKVVSDVAELIIETLNYYDG